MPSNSLANVLCISGLDPSGGAGLQADIETISSCGGHAITMCSALTAQNHRTVQRVQSIEPDMLLNQFSLIKEEFSIDACKIGLIPNYATADVVAQCLKEIAGIPIVLDPVGAAGNGGTLAEQPLDERLKPLLPLCTVLTPNTDELYRLNRSSNQSSRIIEALISSGIEAILVTGADLATDKVENSLYQKDGSSKLFSWPRLAHNYHGSGCTLSSAIATFLARGLNMHAAILEAQMFTWRCLQQAKPVGDQYFPRRITNPATSLMEKKYSCNE